MQGQLVNIFPIQLLHVKSVLNNIAREELSDILDRIEQERALENPEYWSCKVRSSWNYPNTELNDFIRKYFIEHFTQYEQEVFDPDSLASQGTAVWHNRYSQGENQEPHEHIHKDATYCGVYVHKQVKGMSRLEFDDPVGHYKRFSGMYTGWVTAPIEENDLILFPNFLTHRVLSAGDQERTTISLNSFNNYNTE